MKKKFRKITSWLWNAFLWFLAISIFMVLLFKWIPVPWTPLMMSRAIENKMDGNDMVCSHDWVPLEEITPNLQKAVIASEDSTIPATPWF